VLQDRTLPITRIKLRTLHIHGVNAQGNCDSTFPVCGSYINERKNGRAMCGNHSVGRCGLMREN